MRQLKIFFVIVAALCAMACGDPAETGTTAGTSGDTATATEDAASDDAASDDATSGDMLGSSDAGNDSAAVGGLRQVGHVVATGGTRLEGSRFAVSGVSTCLGSCSSTQGARFSVVLSPQGH